MSANPCFFPTSDPQDPFPLIELKQQLMVYTETPPGPKTARSVFDLYDERFGARITRFRTTAMAFLLRDWDSRARRAFLEQELPRLRSKMDWGYRFWDGKGADSWQFMFHGFPPATQPGNAGFFRFEFPWDVDPGVIRDLARALLAFLPCLSGSAGYYLQGRPGSKWENPSFDRMYGLAMRYWGAEAESLDVTVGHVLQGFKCVNWLTVIGDKWRQVAPEAISAAKAVAHQVTETPHATLFQAEEKPRLGDRNRREVLTGYRAVASALLPLQVTEHAAFGGNVWTDDNTIKYLRRFTNP
jgi:hypothetical protein